MKASIPVLALVGVLFLVAVTATRIKPFATDREDLNLRPDDVHVLAVEKRIYATQCTSCHRVRLEGQPEWRIRGAYGLLPAPPHDASGYTWHHPDETLIRITKFGVASIAGDPGYKSSMPIYGGQLTDDKIIAALSWINAHRPAQVGQKHDQMNAQAAKASRR